MESDFSGISQIHSQACSVFGNGHFLPLVIRNVFNIIGAYPDRFLSGLPLRVTGLIARN
jgi:hypothetical protein